MKIEAKESNEGDFLWKDSYKNFEKVCSPSRTEKLFEMLYKTYRYLFLPSVEFQYISTLADIKTTLCLVDVAVDDACDNAILIEKNGGEEFTHNMLRLLYNIDEIIDQEKSKVIDINVRNVGKYHEITYGILKKSIDFCLNLPRFYEFKNEFILANRNVAHSMEFSYIVNSSKIIYPFSYILKNRSASTMVVVHSILDLMCSSDFDKKELGKIIPLFEMADTLAMLSNTIYTWSREILERDYSSPVLALALENNLISFKNFETCDDQEIEEKLLPLLDIIEDEANKIFDMMIKYAKDVKIESIDIFEYIEKCYKAKESFKSPKKYWTSNSTINQQFPLRL